MIPGVGADAVEHPKDAQRLEQSRTFNAANINDRTTECLANLRDSFLGIGIIATDKHVGRTTRKSRVDHMCVPYDIKTLDNARFGQPPLHLFST